MLGLRLELVELQKSNSHFLAILIEHLKLYHDLGF
ncbi:MAG: hypothetical protein ACJAWV_003154 [Flammeovirgaceae bacterium]|jgi:hypothetical protein